MTHKRVFALLFIVVTAMWLSLLNAHAAGGRLEGKVVDPKGGTIAGATVTATNSATRVESKTTTDKEGRYKLEGLEAGVYTVSISARGFREVERTDVQIQEGSVIPLNVNLEIAPVEAE